MTDNSMWQLHRDAEDIVWLVFDTPASAVNVLSAAALLALDEHLQALAAAPPRALVIRSAKSGGFIAGADVNEFTTIADEAAALALIRRGQAVFDRLESLPFTTIALMHGFAMGGGVELALACDYRVAEQAMRLGLPEVKLGIHPGFGGSVRLTRLVGPVKAFGVILSGRAISGRAAKRMGMVDAAVPERHLLNAAHSIAMQPPVRKAPGVLRRVQFITPVRQLIGMLSRRQLAKQANPAHYPAPFAQLDVWSRAGGDARQMMEAEAQSVARLIVTDAAQNLVRAFFLQERLKGLGRDTAARTATRVHVIGAGAMGGDIAAWCAYKGCHVTLQDLNADMIGDALRRARKLCKRKRLRGREASNVMDRMVPDAAGHGIAKADIVIEAVVERLDVKQAIFSDAEARAPADALLASNTSSIPLEQIGSALKDPSRLVGLHFFNPVARMMLVEVVAGSDSAASMLTRATQFTTGIGKLPLPVKSAPGFLVNRILMPYLMEAMRLLQEGVPVADIDRVAVAFGMPMGPLLLADTVGLDVCLAVGEVLTAAYGGEIPAPLSTLVEAGELGKKTGSGIYQHPPRGKATVRYRAPQAQRLADAEIEARLVMSLLNEAQACLDDGIVEDTDLLDAGMIFGTGFAPFRGGPMHYAAARSTEPVPFELNRLAERYGERFKPRPGWSN